MAITCRKNYRNRLEKVMDFWKDKFPEYYTLGVRTVTSDELNDSTKWFFKGRYKRDLIYTGIRADLVLYFWVSMKLKVDGIHKSVGDLRK